MTTPALFKNISKPSEQMVYNTLMRNFAYIENHNTLIKFLTLSQDDF